MFAKIFEPRPRSCSTIPAGENPTLPRPRKTPLETADKPARSPKKKASAPGTTAKRKSVARAETAKPPSPANWLPAVRAAEDKQAKDIVVLDLRDVTTFTDTLILCSAQNARQGQAIADEAERELKKEGEAPLSVEGYKNAEWILMDYGDFVINIFSEKARGYYDLERLWRDAKTVPY
jgi:ribosome-associated protein